MECRCCGEYTRTRDAFGDPICHACWEREDEDISHVERREAAKHGYDEEYYRDLDRTVESR